MKHFIKHSEPEELTEWKEQYPEATYKDLGKDKLFPGAQKARWALRQSLSSEQGYLCCYCESRILNDDFHVEHFRPKDQFASLQLDYANLHASCLRQVVGGSDVHCGHKKANIFSDLLISPLETDCEKHFAYNMMGEVLGIDERGNETIAILNLNSSLLKKSRKALIDEFEDMEEEYEDEITKHLDPNVPILGEFYTTIHYLHSRGLIH